MTAITEQLRLALADRYRIERELGAGGMATVYLARDLKHDRQVALKVLRPELAAILGGERFLSEIKTTANLQHPHILPLHDSGEAGGLVYYVMPFVEGESLRDRITREQQLPVEEAVRITAEVADALEYAHQQGVIHRDVKPENILLHGGHALVADFGIALAASRSDGATRMTETGMSLGTPAYMAPEQAMGERAITPKADIYALGAVLYEMLSGEPPFVGPTAQAIIARVMTEEPRALTLHRHTIPPHVEAATRKALEKLPADRFATAAEFAAALRDPSFRTEAAPAAGVAGAAAVSPQRRLVAVLPWAIAGLAVAATAVALLRPRPAAPVTRYGLALPSSEAPLAMPAVPSPDGSRLLYMGPVPGQPATVTWQLWLKSRDRYEASPIAGTERAWNATFSPDGRWIAFVANSQVMKVAVTGGAPMAIADSASNSQPGLAWLDDGTVIYVQGDGLKLRRVSAAGGPATVVMRSKLTLWGVNALPGSRAVLYTVCQTSACSDLDAMALDLRSGASHVVVAGAEMAQYIPIGDLLYVNLSGAAFAVPFNASTLRVSGAAVSVLDSVSAFQGYPLLAFSRSGTLVLRRGGGGLIAGQYDLVWVDRSGTATPLDMGGPLSIDPGGGNPGWALSPDGRRLAIGLHTGEGGNIWVKQLPDGALSRVTFDSVPDLRPRWLPGGRAISFVTPRNGQLELRDVSADGTGGETVLARNPNEIYEGAVSPDGGWIVVRVRGGIGAQRREILGYRAGDTTAVPLIVNAGYDQNAFRISPDGRWIAYESDETGRREVYVRPFPNTNAGKWQASTDGGYAPLWAPTGRELFFVDAQRRMTVVPFTPGSPPRLGTPKVLFTLGSDLYLWENDYYTPFDISPDGRRFVMARQIGATGAAQSPLIVVDNWFTELKREMAGK